MFTRSKTKNKQEGETNKHLSTSSTISNASSISTDEPGIGRQSSIDQLQKIIGEPLSSINQVNIENVFSSPKTTAMGEGTTATNQKQPSSNQR